MESFGIAREDSEIASKSLTQNEDNLLLSIVKEHIDEYLTAGQVNSDVSEELLTFLENVRVDDSLLMKYIRGRKNDPLYAWETIRHYAENKFQIYPDLFPGPVMPESVRQLLAMHAIGRLRNRDKLGRRIIFLDTTKWDVNTHTLDDLLKAALCGVDRFWTDQEVQEYGSIIIENAAGIGTAHVKQLSWHNLQKMRNIFVHSYPVSPKGIFFVNMPLILNLVLKMSRSLIPKKIRKRMFIYGHNEVPQNLLEVASPEILPEWVGGTLPIEEAALDVSFYYN